MAKPCPVCLGDGAFDFTDTDAILSEHLPPEVWAQVGPRGIVECPECEGIRVVTDDRAREIEAWAVASVDQAIAEYKLREKQGLL